MLKSRDFSNTLIAIIPYFWTLLFILPYFRLAKRLCYVTYGTKATIRNKQKRSSFKEAVLAQQFTMAAERRMCTGAEVASNEL